MMVVSDRFEVPRSFFEELKMNLSKDSSNFLKHLIEATLGQKALEILSMRKVRPCLIILIFCYSYAM